jgi:hypothetical protein
MCAPDLHGFYLCLIKTCVCIFLFVVKFWIYSFMVWFYQKNTDSRPISALTRPDRIVFRFPYLSRLFSLPIYPVFVFVPQGKYENENGRDIFPTVLDRFHPYQRHGLFPQCAHWPAGHRTGDHFFDSNVYIYLLVT